MKKLMNFNESSVTLVKKAILVALGLATMLYVSKAEQNEKEEIKYTVSYTEKVNESEVQVDEIIQIEEKTYILNENSMKFHEENCRYVSQMLKENRKVHIGTRDEILELGFDRCKICSP